MRAVAALIAFTLIVGAVAYDYDTEYDLEKDGALAKDNSQLNSIDDSLSNAPASVPRELLTSFASELRGIRVSLEQQREELRASLKTKQDAVDKIKAGIAKQEKKIAEINEKTRQLKARMERKDKVKRKTNFLPFSVCISFRFLC